MIVVKNSSANAGDIRDPDLTLGSGRSPGGGYGNPLHLSCLGNPIDRGPEGLQFIGSQRIQHNWSDLALLLLSPILFDPMTAACQAPPSSTISWILLKFTSIELVMLSHPLLPPSPFAFNLCQHQGLFQWLSSSHQVAKVLEIPLQHQSFQQICRVDFL